MKLILNNLNYYFLTVSKVNNERKKHILEEFKELNLKEINPIPASYFNKNKNLSKHQIKSKSGVTGWLKILDLASQEMGNNFQPFVIFEDIEYNNDIIRIFNMLSSHGIIICSLRGMLSLQKCLLDDFYKNQGWDRSICYIQPYLNVYALKEPLVYQYSKLGGEELYTKINFQKLKKKPLPEKWKNKTNLSIITMY